MEGLPEDQLKLMCSKEWLVKVDSQQSTPYLFKFHSSKIDMTCMVMITDTKSVWSEVLTSSQVARRWRACNKVDPFMALSAEQEEAEEEWRLSILGNLSEIHTPGGIDNASFDVISTRFSDLAFEIEYEGIRWTWETCFIGHKSSAEVISRHLVLPLLSVTHAAFSVSKPAGEMVESELEKAIDGVGRAARRSVDTHIKNVISKARIYSSMRRMTALYTLSDHLPPISLQNEEPKLQIAAPPRIRTPDRLPLPTKARAISPTLMEQSNLVKTPPILSSPPSTSRAQESSIIVAKQSSTEESATESDDDEPEAKVTSFAPASTPSISQRPGSSQLPVKPATVPKEPSPDSDSSPPRPPTKKKKATVTSSSDDSEEERRRRVAKLKSGTASARGGVRQPLKRGGRRF
ncbi:hypothetical protein F5878DRAFT_16343 [Lentinula raphanica]|uniref:XLF-like N-terminal domain-containing protein n=1 Tax=Lentinula raphanica TaxID=153919 RepID=A0AA38NXF7_9AGAR|nr:hypothetical protein F5878DRAFT_16343 [Lentinula raphanica]